MVPYGSLKCAIIECVGVKLKAADLRKYRARIWKNNPSSHPNGVSYEEFAQLLSDVSQDFLLFQGSPVYAALDARGRGCVTEDDYLHNLAKIAPRYAAAYGRDLFRAMDVYGVRQISKPSMLKMLDNCST